MTQHPSRARDRFSLVRVFLRALPELWRSAPPLVTLMLIVSVVQGALPAVTILLGKLTVDGVVSVTQGQNVPLTPLALAWAGTALLAQLAVIVNRLVQGVVADHYTIDVTTRLMRRMYDLVGLDVLEDPAFHDDIEELQTGAPRRPLNLVAVTLWLLSSVIGIVGVALTLVTVAWWVPLVVVLGMLPLASRQMKLYELGYSLTVQRTQEARELAYVQRVAMRHEYAREVRLYDLMPHLQGRFVTQARAYHGALRGVRARMLLGVLPMTLASLLVTSLVFVYTVQQAGAGMLSAGSVVLVVAALAQMRDALTHTSEYVGMLTEHLKWFEKYQRFLDAAPVVASPAAPRPLPARLDLHLENVTFAYRGAPPALTDVSLSIPFGQTVAIVGENGAGKSTLVKLLLRFYDPTDGRVRVGDVELRDLDVRAWRAQCAGVFQDFARFDWTVGENVTLGREVDAARLTRVSGESGLADVLERLSNGLDTRLGVAFGGVDLSGGQWQKLATARALYRDARVLILDEPTAALDPRSEAEVFERFASLARGRTTLLVTHRLGSVVMADRILVMKAGRIIEDGPHAELLAQGGEYATLWRLQARQYAEAALA